MKASFVRKHNVCSNIWEFEFKPEKNIRYIAGQFIELTLEHASDDRGNRRWFTLSSAPYEENLKISTRINDTKPSSFKNALKALSTQDKVDISAPLGDFVLPKNTDIPIIMIAQGIGYTPFESILKDVQHNKESRDISIIHMTDDPGFNIFKDLANNHIQIDKTDESQLNKLLQSLASPDHYVYVSGPEEFVEKQLENMGQIKRSQIFTDFFHGY